MDLPFVNVLCTANVHGEVPAPLVGAARCGGIGKMEVLLENSVLLRWNKTKADSNA